MLLNSKLPFLFFLHTLTDVDLRDVCSPEYLQGTSQSKQESPESSEVWEKKDCDQVQVQWSDEPASADIKLVTN